MLFLTNKNHVTYDTGQDRTRTTLVSGWRALSPLRQSCSKVMLQKWAAKYWALKPRSNLSEVCPLFNFRFVMVLITPLLENIFSNSLTMHQAQRKEILTVTVYGYRIFFNIDFYDFVSVFSSNIQDHVWPGTFPKTSKLFNAPLRLVFWALFSVEMRTTDSLVFKYYLKLLFKRQRHSTV